jgi:hypothetical protein
MTNRPQQPNQTSRPAPGGPADDYQPPRAQPHRGGNQRMGLGETVIKSLIRSIASSLGRTIVRTIQRRLR